jgi:hypothetical protein
VTTVAALPLVTEQWLAVRKNGRLSCCVLLTMAPVHRLDPEMVKRATERIWLGQALPCGQVTSTLQAPDFSNASVEKPR